MSDKHIDKLIEQLGILIVDGSQYTRKLTRMMLMNIGAKTVYEASDGVAALDLIRTANPDVAFVDWELPVLSGPQLIRIIRSPGVFPKPSLPIVMLTQSAQRSRVQAAMNLGVHEFLVKPTSPKALRDRLLSILVKPRAMMVVGENYVPEPRRLAAAAEAEVVSVP
jgi:two-component system, chemotaxis family, chemotaxis protein CheY